MNRKFCNCKLTNTSSEVIREYDVSMRSKSYHTGIDIAAKTVYSICYGVILQVYKSSQKHYTVTIQYDHNICIRLCHLESVQVRQGQLIKLNDIVGFADKYVHFEYLNIESDDTRWHIRINDSTYYICNPNLILNDDVNISNEPETKTYYSVDPEIQTWYTDSDLDN